MPPKGKKHARGRMSLVAMAGLPPYHDRSPRRKAAVDGEFSAGDESRFIRQQIDAQVGDFSGGAEAANKRAVPRIAANPFRI